MHPSHDASDQFYAEISFANLATAAAADKDVIKTLTETNAMLVTEIDKVRQAMAALEAPITTNTTPPPPPTDPRRGKRAPDGLRATNNDNHCWTHGFQVGATHTSHACPAKKAGHQDAATKDNTMGGSQRGKM